MKSIQIQSQAQCGAWCKVQSIDAGKVDLSALPRAIKRQKNQSTDKLLADYGALQLDRWCRAMPNRNFRLVEVEERW